MHREPIFEWQGHEYEFEERGPDWYWAVGIVAAAICIVSILFGNVLLALVAVAGAAALMLQAAKHHREHTFSLYETGVRIDNEFYAYENMRDFAVLEFIDPELPPALSFKTNHILAPHILVPIHDFDPEGVYEFVNQFVPEGDHQETLVDRIAAILRL